MDFQRIWMILSLPPTIRIRGIDWRGQKDSKGRFKPQKWQNKKMQNFERIC